MHYRFPIILHIDDVLPSIQDAEDFRVIEKDDYTVINYMLQGNDTFPPVPNDKEESELTGNEWHAMIRRECRGLVFAKNGKLIRRAFHKFFNLGEREETLEANVDFSIPYVVLEKLDGSMVTPLPLDSGLRWATKMGITDVSMQAEVFVAKNPKYQAFAKKTIDCGILPIFEWCSPKNRIVISHKEDSLILVAIRKQSTGEYCPYNHLKAIANYDDIPYVPESRRPDDNTTDTEGVVLSFDNGHKLKVKTRWYVDIHRAKENLLNEKRVLAMILDDKVDDVLPFLPDEDRNALIKYQTAVNKGIGETYNDLKGWWFRANRGTMEPAPTRKEFALDIAPLLPNLYPAILFQAWDNLDLLHKALLDIIRKNLGSQTSVDKVRHLFKAEWNSTENDDVL